jgi:hypothetical protein
MSQATTGNGKEPAPDSPPLRRDAHGRVDVDSVPDVIQWFLDYDHRVGIVKHPRVEEVFQWKQVRQSQRRRRGFQFRRAEDRLAIGIIQALAENSNERALHGWISHSLPRSTLLPRRTKQPPRPFDSISRARSPLSAKPTKIHNTTWPQDFLINCWV